MSNQQNPSARGAKHPNDPGKNDPASQDERDNDTPKEKKVEESESSKGNTGSPEVEKPTGELNEGRQEHKPRPVKESSLQEDTSINKGDHNIASPEQKQNEASEKDDEGNPVMKAFGPGL